MKTNLLLVSGIAVGLSVVAANAAPSGSDSGYTRHAVHRHHVARNRMPDGQVSDVPQESAPPPAKVEPDPYYYNHAGTGTSYY